MFKGTFGSLSINTLLELRYLTEHIVSRTMTAQTYNYNSAIVYSPDVYPVMASDPWLYESSSAEVGVLVSEQVLSLHVVETTKGAEDYLFASNRLSFSFSFRGPAWNHRPITASTVPTLRWMRARCRGSNYNKNYNNNTI